MSLDDEIFSATRDYIQGRLSLRDLFKWVFDREPYWGESAQGRDSAKLASAIELVVFEIQAGDRDEASAREVIAEDLAQLTTARPS